MVKLKRGEKRVETLSSACGESRVQTSHRGSRLGTKGQGVSLQRHHCRAAFLSKGKSVTARVPRRASPPGLPPACMPPTGLRWRCTAVRGWPAPPVHFFLEPTICVQAATPGKGNPGQRFRLILPPSALPAGETMQAHREPRGAGAESGQRAGADPGAVPGTGSAEFPRRARECRGPGFVPRGGGEALRVPSCPPAHRHGQKRKRRKLIAITYEGKRFLG